MESGEFLGDSKDPRAEEFKKHLTDTGLMDVLTKVLAQLYDSAEKPTESEVYCRDFFSRMEGVDMAAVLAENEQLKAKIEELTKTAEELTKELEDPNA